MSVRKFSSDTKADESIASEEEMHRADNLDLFQISLDPCIKPVQVFNPCIKPVEDVLSNTEVTFKKCNHFRNVAANCL